MNKIELREIIRKICCHGKGKYMNELLDNHSLHEKDYVY